MLHVIDQKSTTAEVGASEAQIEWMRSTARVKEELPPRVLFLGTDFYQGSRIYIDGYSGAGKSMLLLGIAQAIAAGSPFCGWRRGNKPSVVLFLDYEMGREELQKRLRFFQHPNLFAVSFDDPQLDSDDESASAAKAKRVKWDGGLPAVDTPLGQKLVENLIRATGATTVIIDNLYAACDGDLLGGASTRGGFQAHEVLVPWARRMSKAGVQTIWVQHSNEQGSPYGDKRLNRQMYLHLHVDRQRSPDEQRLVLKVTTVKRRGGGLPSPWTAGWEPRSGWLQMEGAEGDKRDMTGSMALFLDAVNRAPQGPNPRVEEVPSYVTVKDIEEVRELFYEALGDKDPATKRQQFNRVKKKAIDKLLVGVWLESIWLMPA